MRIARFVRGAVVGLLCLAAAAAHAASYQQIYAFKGSGENDGFYPSGRLSAVGGQLLGPTVYGRGATVCPDSDSGCGTIFSVTPAGVETVVYSFPGFPGGEAPQGSFYAAGGLLYGETGFGGHDTCPEVNHEGCGTVYTLAPNNVVTTRYAFAGVADGYQPGDVTSIGAVLYGTTFRGGLHDYGTVYALAADGTKTTLHAFTGGADGGYPENLIHVGNTLYGTTDSGGGGPCNQGCGVFFKMTTSGAETVVYAYHGGDLPGPPNSLILVGDTLYGTTATGGTNACTCGTLFSMTLTGKLNGFVSFDGNDGSDPTGGLIYKDGTFYGTTQSGGGTLCNCGTVFAYRPGGPIQLLHAFTGGSDGEVPKEGLTELGGALYGTTVAGGVSCSVESAGCGTVFRIVP